MLIDLILLGKLSVRVKPLNSTIRAIAVIPMKLRLFSRTFCLILATCFASCSYSVATENSDEDLAYLMSLTLEQLGEITVESATLQPEKLADIPAVAIVITAQQIQERGYELFGDLLRDVPGFDLVHVNGTYRTIFSQRGTYTGENNRSLILIDGVVESNILEGSLLHGGQYSLHNVEKVEFIYGPASALYGANAFGGIISITTKKAADMNRFNYELGVGSYSTQFHKFNASSQLGEVDVSLSGHIYDTDGVDFAKRGSAYSNSYVDDAYAISLRAQYRGMTFGYNKYDRPSGLGTFSNISGFEALNNDGLAGPGLLQNDFNGEKPSLWHMQSETLYAKAGFSLSDYTTINSSFFARESSIGLDSYSINYIPTTISLERNSFGHVSDTVGADIRLDYLPEANWDLIAGLKWEVSDVERGYRTKVNQGTDVSTEGIEFTRIGQLGDPARISDTYRNIAFYTQFRKALDWGWPTKLILGARYDYNNQYGRSFAFAETFNPRLGIVAEPNPETRLKLLYGTAFRAPTSFDRFTSTEVRIANPDLTPEKLQTLEFIATRRFSETLYAEINLYRNSFENSILSNVDTGIPIPDNPSINFTQNQNAGEGQAFGIELRLTAVIDNVELFLNGTYQNAEQELSDGENIDWPNIADAKANIGVTWRYTDQLSLFASHNWVGKRGTTPSNPLDSVDGYSVTNINALWRGFLLDNIDLSLRIDNIFDQDWVDPGIRTADGGFYDTLNPQPGRNYQLTLGIKF